MQKEELSEIFKVGKGKKKKNPKHQYRTVCAVKSSLKMKEIMIFWKKKKSGGEPQQGHLLPVELFHRNS